VLIVSFLDMDGRSRQFGGNSHETPMEAPALPVAGRADPERLLRSAIRTAEAALLPPNETVGS